MVDAIRQAKAGRRGDPLLLLREGSSLLPPQNYSLRQYQAPPPWELAGTGGYHPQDRRQQAAQGLGRAGVDPPPAAGEAVRQGSLREMLDEQIREKKLRANYEQSKLAEEERNAFGALPSYLNSHRGGGGDAMRKGTREHGDGTPPERSYREPPQQPPSQAYADNDSLPFAKGADHRAGSSAAVAALPLHGRRSQYHGDEPVSVAGSGGNILSSIEEEKSIEQKLYEPTSPQHARFRLSYADPETQMQMMRKEQERKAMREILSAQIAEKEERRMLNLREGQRRDADEYQQERLQQEFVNERDRRGGRQVMPPQQSQDQQHDDSASNYNPDDGAGFKHAQPSWQQQESNSVARWQPPPVALPSGQVNPASGGRSSLELAHEPQGHANNLSSKYGVPSSISYPPQNLALGRSTASQRDYDGNMFSMHHTGASSGSGSAHAGGTHDWAAADLFGAPRDSLDELKTLCKELLVEQQGLRSQLANQSNVVSQLRIAAKRGPASRTGLQPRYLVVAGGTDSVTASRAVPHQRRAASAMPVQSGRVTAEQQDGTRGVSARSQGAQFGAVDIASDQRQGELRQWVAQRPQHREVFTRDTSHKHSHRHEDDSHHEPAETAPPWLRPEANLAMPPRSPPIPTHQEGRQTSGLMDSQPSELLNDASSGAAEVNTEQFAAGDRAAQTRKKSRHTDAKDKFKPPTRRRGNGPTGN